MKCCTLLLFAVLSSSSLAEDLTMYRYCHSMYQHLQAKQSEVNRLYRTISFHKQAFEKYSQAKTENLANFHKEHQDSLSTIYQNQQQKVKKELDTFQKECADSPHNPLVKTNYSNEYILLPI